MISPVAICMTYWLFILASRVSVILPDLQQKTVVALPPCLNIHTGAQVNMSEDVSVRK